MDEGPGLGYEVRDANPRLIAWTAIGALITGLVIFIVMRWIFFGFEHSIERSWRPRSSLPTVEALPPEPRLQLNPAEDLRIFRERESQALHSVGWVDRQGGWARIPIDDAMDLIVQERGQQ